MSAALARPALWSALAALALLVLPLAAPWASAASGALPAGRAVLVVPDDYPSIQEAVDAAGDGDVVYVRAGVYVESVVVEWKSIAIQAEEGAVLVPASGYSYALRVASGSVNVTGLAINCTGVEGAVAMRVEGATVALRGVVVAGCRGVFSLAGSFRGVLESSRVEGAGYLAEAGYGTGGVVVRSSVVEGCPAASGLSYIDVGDSVLAAGAGGGTVGPCGLGVLNARFSNATLVDLTVVLSGDGSGVAELSGVALDNSSLGVERYYNVYVRGLSMEGGGPSALWADAYSVAVEGVESRGVPEAYIALRAPYVHVSRVSLDARGALEAWHDSGSVAELRDSTVRLEALDIHGFGRVVVSNVSVAAANYTVLQAVDVLEVAGSTLEAPPAPPAEPPPIHLEASYVYVNSTLLHGRVEAVAQRSMEVRGSRVEGGLTALLGPGGRLSVVDSSMGRLEVLAEGGGSAVEVSDSTIAETAVRGADYIHVTGLRAEGCGGACLGATGFQVLNITGSTLAPGGGGLALNATGSVLAVADAALSGGWAVSVVSARLLNVTLGPGGYAAEAGSVVLEGCRVHSARLDIGAAEALIVGSTLDDTDVYIAVGEGGRAVLEGAAVTGGSLRASLPAGSHVLINSSRLEGLRFIEAEGEGRLAIASSTLEAEGGLRLRGGVQLSAVDSRIAGGGGASIVFDPEAAVSLRRVELTGALSPVAGPGVCNLSIEAVGVTVNGAPLLVNPSEPPSGPVGQVILIGVEAPGLRLPAPPGPASPYLLAVASEIPLLTVDASGEASVMLACSRAVIVNSTLAGPSALVLIGSEATVYLSTIEPGAIRALGGSAVYASSPSVLVYEYEGRVYRGVLGNYWPGAGVADSDGDGVGDEPLEAGGVVDCAPLTAPPSAYRVLGEAPPAEPASAAVEAGGVLEIVPHATGTLRVYIDGVLYYNGPATRGEAVGVTLPPTLEPGAHQLHLELDLPRPCPARTLTATLQLEVTPPGAPTPAPTTTPPATATTTADTAPPPTATGAPATSRPGAAPPAPAAATQPPQQAAPGEWGPARLLAAGFTALLALLGAYLTVRR